MAQDPKGTYTLGSKASVETTHHAGESGVAALLNSEHAAVDSHGHHEMGDHDPDPGYGFDDYSSYGGDCSF